MCNNMCKEISTIGFLMVRWRPYYAATVTDIEVQLRNPQIYVAIKS